MQDGENDLDLQYGSWWLANQTLAQSLSFAGYDHVFVRGKGFHSNSHMIAILPDALRWSWRDWRTDLAAALQSQCTAGRGDDWRTTCAICWH